ncbi:hypothetical protein AMAG_07563 [Allomyces macrogynus ATCC 38327]|uniref:AAA+ ATPase domain-containing protein n=1 Tax=Allomyces macrogynus (strain ATCC 38327) TaxID=578462 RepID=A0A0L0SIK1_ALLM3|nr:hypothetical protein AMAG_07563 [Allomyces macrogynus ATCC 38327]|eukprot:KNE62333.1 hypothetical protein AMAG_07563 [Allomyces macrogynus ATCC 38327]
MSFPVPSDPLLPEASAAPAYNACLTAACDILATQPMELASIDALATKLDADYASVLTALGGVRQLAIEFPDHVAYNVISDVLVLIAHPSDLTPLDDCMIDARRYALRLLFAYNQNETGTSTAEIAAAVFARHAETIRGIGGPETLARAYPDLLELRPDGTMELIDVPPNVVAPMSLNDLATLPMSDASLAKLTLDPVEGLSTKLPMRDASFDESLSPIQDFGGADTAALPAHALDPATIDCADPDSSSILPASERDPGLPYFGTCLRATCAFLQQRPNGEAPLTDLAPIAFQFPKVVAELTTLLELAIEFPSHVRFVAQTHALRLLSVDFSTLPSDLAIQQRRHALRLILAHNGNRLGRVQSSVVARVLAQHKDKTGGILDVGVLNSVYRPFLRLDARGDLRIFALPSRLFDSCLQDADSADTTVKQASHCAQMAHPSLVKPEFIMQPAGQRTVTMWKNAATSASKRYWSSPIPDKWRTSTSTSVSSVYLVSTVSDAQAISAALLERQVHRFALGIEGRFAAGSFVTVDVILLSFQSPHDSSRQVVLVWDLARTDIGEHDGMIVAIKQLFEDSKTMFVVHGGGAVLEALSRLLDLQLPLQRTLDTQSLFTDWLEWYAVVRAENWRSNDPCSPLSRFDPTYLYDLMAVLEECDKEYRQWSMYSGNAQRKNDFGSMLIGRSGRTNLLIPRSFWDLHAKQETMLAFAAFLVERLVPLADHLLGLTDHMIARHESAEGRSGLSPGSTFDPISCEPSAPVGKLWKTIAPLPKGRLVQARFVSGVQNHVWRPEAVANMPIYPLPDEGAMELFAKPDPIDAAEHNQLAMDRLLAIFPKHLPAALEAIPRALDSVHQILLDLDQHPQLFMIDAADNVRRHVLKECRLVTRADLSLICDSLTFTTTDCAGLDGSLHRISRIVNKNGLVIGLTIRMGRLFPPNKSVGRLLLDLIYKAGQSILITGAPGSGRTSVLRDLAARLAARGHQVLVIDTYNEIGGDGDVPHPALGKCRRIQVADRAAQHAQIVNGVRNHQPDIIVIDEIATHDDVAALQLIAPCVRAVIAATSGSFPSAFLSLVLHRLIGHVFDAAVTLLPGHSSVTVRHGLLDTVMDIENPKHESICGAWITNPPVWRIEHRWLPGARNVPLTKGGTGEMAGEDTFWVKAEPFVVR